MPRFNLTGLLMVDDGRTFAIAQDGDSDSVTSTTAGPTVVDDTAVAVASGANVTISPLVNDADPAGGGLTITAASVTSGGGSVSISGGTQLVYTPPTSAGSATINYTVEDANSATDSGDVVVTIAASSGTKTAVITADKATTGFFAPAGYHFEIELDGFSALDVPMQDTRIEWSFGDTGATFSDLSGRLDMLRDMDSGMLAWNNANKGYGFMAAHVYQTPGTYTVQAQVRDSLTGDVILSNSLSITVSDPDSVFSAAKTVYASNDAADAALVPGGAVFVHTSDFHTAYWSVSEPRRLKLKRGDTFAASGPKGGAGQTLIEDWGNAGDARPIIDVSANDHGAKAQLTQLAYKNVQIIGNHSQASATSGSSNTGFDFYKDGSGAIGGMIVLDNVKIAQCGKSCISATDLNQNALSSVYFLDIDVTDWLNYGVYGKFYRVAFLGSWIHCNVDGYKVNMDSGGGSGMRIEAFGVPSEGGAVFCCSDVFMNYAGRFTGDQPGYKVQGDSVLDSRWVWDRVITEGSSDTSHGVGSTIPDRQFALIDKHIHIGTAQCGLPLSIQQTGTTVRNYLYIAPHVANEKLAIKEIDSNYALNVNTGGSTAENLAGWFYTYGNTVMQWQDMVTMTEHPANFTMVNADINVGDEVTTNNVIFAPFDFTPQTTGVTLEGGITGVANYAGRKLTDENGGALQTEYATDDTFTFGTYTNQHIFCIARPSGANLTADQGASDKVPIDYIDGTLRGASPAKGAFPPA